MKPLLLILICSLLFIQINAQTISKTETDKKTDSSFKHFTEHTPGAAVTVLQNGKIVTKKNYGRAHLEHVIPFTHETPVRLVYSMGREFMSVGLAMMEADGLLSFDDKVRKYFPKLPDWSRDVTVRDLLNHASGFDDEWSLLLLMTADMRSQVETEQVLTLLYNQPKPQVEPGKGYMYNNTDFALLRLIMEAASKKSLPDYLKVKLFDPIEMKSTLMNDDTEQIIPGLAENYYDYPFRKARFIKFSPGGNYRMVTTADDLEKWARASENPSSIVGKAFARLYRNARPIPTYPDEKQYVFGHTIRMINGTAFIYHGGVGDSFYIVRIPSKKISVIGLGNGSNFIRPAMQLAESFIASKPGKNKSIFFPSEAVTLSKDEMAAYTGRYYDQRVGYNSHIPSIRYFDLKIVGDSLRFYQDSDGASFTISAFGNDYFKDNEEGAKIQFIKSQDGSPMKMKVWMDEGSNEHFYVRNEDTVVADKKYLDQFTGQYYSPHLDYYLRIVMNTDGQLVIKRPTMPDSVIEPYGKDSFKVEQKNGSYSVYMIASFSKDSAGNIDGFTLRDSRMMHHRFDKVE